MIEYLIRVKYRSSNAYVGTELHAMAESFKECLDKVMALSILENAEISFLSIEVVTR